MDARLLCVHLQDSYPLSAVDVESREDLLHTDFHEQIPQHRVQKNKDGCIAFVFGRTESGKSVCMIVEGFQPRLYYKSTLGENLNDVKRELESQVRAHLRNTRGLSLARVRMAHSYGYEHDEQSASGRKIHDYVEVRYPSLGSFRAAANITKKFLLKRCRARIATLKATREELLKHHATHAAEVTAIDDDIKGMEKRRECLHVRDEGTIPEMTRFAQEYKIPPDLVFMHLFKASPGSWVRALDVVDHVSRISTCDIECMCTGFVRIEDKLIDPWVKLSYDIETLGLEKETKQCIQISISLKRGDDPVENHLIALGTVEPRPEFDGLHCCNTEQELLLTFRKLVIRMDPDICMYYNGINFDNPFLNTRAHVTGAVTKSFFYLSRFAFQKASFSETSLASEQMGESSMRFFAMPGRVNKDIWFVLKGTYQSEPSNSLNHFAQKFLGEQKGDVSYKEIPTLQAGTAADRAKLGQYAVLDAALLHGLDSAVNIMTGMFEFAALYTIHPEHVDFRGQQVKLIALLVGVIRTIEEVPMLLQDPVDHGFVGEGTLSYTGGAVNQPMSGFYTEKIIVLDWMSLYPMLQCDNNLCFSTHDIHGVLAGQYGIKTFDLGDRRVHFATRERRLGVLPKVIEMLLEKRSAAKKQMKRHSSQHDDATLPDADRARHKAIADICEKRQLALKVGCNSVYGLTGANTTGKIIDLDVSATITHLGREAMEHKKKLIPEEFPGSIVVYGDTDSVFIKPADTACLEWRPCDLDTSCCKELQSERLRSHLLTGKREFTAGEWASLQIMNVKQTDYVQVGGVCYRPCGTVLTNEDAARIGAEMATFVTKYFRDVLHNARMTLEFENIYNPLLLNGKKQYAGISYEPDARGGMQRKGMKVKGMKIVRGDTVPLVKDMMKEVCHVLFEKMDEFAALNVFRSHMRALVEDTIPFAQYIMKTTFSTKVEHKVDTIAHARVNAERKARDPGSEAAPNEHVFYVSINGNINTKATFLAKDAIFAKEDGDKINRLWYFDKRVDGEIRRILQHFPHLDLGHELRAIREQLDAARIGTSSCLKDLCVSGEASSSSAPYVPSKCYRPSQSSITPRKKKKR